MVDAGSGRRVAAFASVQRILYATNTAYDARTAQLLGSGNCVAKAQLLRDAFLALGHDARVVRWTYRLDDPFVDLLPIDVDVHTATQVHLHDEWVTVDATHDPGLPTPPFVVGAWDGRRATESVYEPISDVWVPGVDDAAIAAAITEIVGALAGHDTHEYNARFNEWLVELRART